MLNSELVELTLNHMRELGIYPASPRDADLIVDGKIHRYRIEGRKRGSKDGAYALHNDEYGVAGYLKDWGSTGVNENWTPHGYEKMSNDFDYEAFHKEREKRERQIKKEQSDAAERTRIKFEHAAPAPVDFPYLVKKGIRPHGVRWDKTTNSLIVPILNIEGKFSSHQWIKADGSKMNASGGKIEGCFFPIDLDKVNSKNNVVLLGEGFATMAKIYELTGRPCVAAMSVGQLENVANVLSKKFPKIKIIIMADNDHTKKENKGLDTAYAVQKRNASVVAVLYPPFESWDDGTDWDDYVLAFGENSHGIEKMLRDVLYYSLDDDGKREMERTELFTSLSMPLSPYVSVPALEFVGGMFPRGYLSAIVAPSGTGKTMFEQKFCSDLSVGGSILGGFIDDEPARRSLIFAAEAGFDTLVRRAKSLKWEVESKNFIVVDQFALEQNNISVLLDEEEGFNNMRRFIEINRPDIVFFDTFMNFHDKDENKATDIKPILQNLLNLARRFNIAVVLVHHTRKRLAKERLLDLNQDDAIGSSVFNRLVSLIVGLEPSKDVENVISVKVLKTWFKSFAPFSYSISENEDGNANFEIYLASETPATVQKTRDSLLEYLFATFTPGDWFSVSDIKIENMSLKQIKRSLSTLLKDEKIKKKGSTKNTEYTLIGFYG